MSHKSEQQRNSELEAKYGQFLTAPNFMLNPQMMFDIMKAFRLTMPNEKPIPKVTSITLVPVALDEEYAKKWNTEHCRDYVHVYKDGKKVSDTLYRVGGFGGDIETPYFLLLKYIEEYYEDNITKIKKDKPHLAGYWCIINSDGKEMVVFDSFKTPYLHGGVTYSVDSNYYNIETGELYGNSHGGTMGTDEFLFLNNRYDKDHSRRGVIKINKHDGTYELFPEKGGKL